MNALPAFWAAVRVVCGKKRLGHAAKRAIEWQGLVFKYVETRPRDGARFECAYESNFIDQGPTCRIDDNGFASTLREAFGVEDVMARRIEVAVQSYKIGLL
jgi:hypothetical protein